MLGRLPSELARAATPADIDELILYFTEIEALPDASRDAAMICSVVANSNRSKGRAFQPRDFMPHPPVKHKQTTEAMQRTFDMLGGD